MKIQNLQKNSTKIYVDLLETRNPMVKFVFQLELPFTQNKFKQFVAVHQRRIKVRLIEILFLGFGEGTAGIASMWLVWRFDGQICGKKFNRVSCFRLALELACVCFWKEDGSRVRDSGG